MREEVTQFGDKPKPLDGDGDHDIIIARCIVYALCQLNILFSNHKAILRLLCQIVSCYLFDMKKKGMGKKQKEMKLEEGMEEEEEDDDPTPTRMRVN